VNQEIQDEMVSQVLKVMQAKGTQDLQVIQEAMVLQENRGWMANQEKMELLVQLDQQELVMLVHQDHKEPRVIQVQMVFQANLVKQGILVLRVTKVSQVQQVQRVQSVRQAKMVLPVLKVMKKMDHQDQQDHQDHQAILTTVLQALQVLQVLQATILKLPITGVMKVG